MPTVKSATKDSTKGIGSQVLTPRRARHKSRSHKIEGSSVDIRRNEDGSERRRSSSLGRRLLDAAVSHISFRRPRSRSKSRSRTSELEISGPIIAYPMTEICRQNTLLGPDEHTAPDNTDEHNNRSAYHIYSNEIGSKIQPKNPPHDDAPSETDSAQFRPLTPSIPPRSVQPADEKQDEPTILSRVLAPRDAYAETRCAVCLERVFLRDQYQLIDRVLHRSCFTCSVCGTELINRSAVCQHGIWSCFRHTQNDMTRTPVPTESAS